MKYRAPLILWGIIGTTAGYAIHPESNPFDTLKVHEQVLRPTLSKPTTDSSFTDNFVIRTDSKNGAIRLITGQLSDNVIKNWQDPAPFIGVAKTFLDEHAQILAIPFETLELDRNALLLSNEHQFLMFRVVRDGLKVEDAAVSFRFKFGRLYQVVNHSFMETKVPGSASVLTSQQVQARTGGSVTEVGQALRVVEVAKGYRMIRVAKYIVEENGRSYTVAIDLHDQKIFEVKPNQHNHAGHATLEIYPRWYNEEAVTKPYPFGFGQVGAKRFSTDFDGMFEFEASGTPKIDGLEGKFAKINLISGTPIQAIGHQDEEGDEWRIHVGFTPERSPWIGKDVAQTMAFYHLNSIVSEAKKFIDTAWLHEPLTANTNLNQSCNAHWDRMERTVNFYSGNGTCANSALISDVIFHEWGHGLDEMTGGIEDGAFSEGFGDIMSLMMTRSNILGIGFFSNGDPVRDLEPNRSYPEHANGGVHSEGLIIGSTFFDLFQALTLIHGEDTAVDLLKKYAFNMILTARTYREVYDALLVIDDNDDNPMTRSPNHCVLNEVFASHGLAEEDIGCRLATVEEFSVLGGDGDGVVEPGETLEILVAAGNPSNQELQSLSGKIAVTTGAAQFTEPKLFWQNIPAGAQAWSTAAVLEVDADAECGSDILTNLEIRKDDRQVVTTQELTVGRDVAVEERISAEGLPQPIEDKNTTETHMTIDSEQWGADAKVRSLNLKLALTHTWIGDLAIELTSPGGKTVEIFRGSGRGQGRLEKTFDVTQKFRGEVGVGDWTVKVHDRATRDTGTLDSVEIIARPHAFICD